MRPQPTDRLDLAADLEFQDLENEAASRHPEFAAACDLAARERRPAPAAPAGYRAALERGHAVLPRQCGTCSACCWTYDVPEFDKHARCDCPQLAAGRCGIYPDRPNACLEFACDWLRGRLPDWASPTATGLVSRLVPIQSLSQLFLSATPVIAELSETHEDAARRGDGAALVAMLLRDGLTVRITSSTGAIRIAVPGGIERPFDPARLPTWLFRRADPASDQGGERFVLAADPAVEVTTAPCFDGDQLDDWFDAHVTKAAGDQRPLAEVRDQLTRQIATAFCASLSGLELLDPAARRSVRAAAAGVAELFLDGLIDAEDDQAE